MMVEPQSKKTFLATRSIANLLPPLAAAAAGASVLGLLGGWREANAYFSGIGASWFVASLTPTLLLERMINLMLVLILSTFFSIHYVSRGEASDRGLRRFSIFFMFVSLALFLFSLLAENWVSKKSLFSCATASALAIAAASGTTIGELVSRLAAKNLKWGSYDALLMYFVVSFVLIQAPDRIGMARANYHLDSESNGLPTVELSSPTAGRSWKLVSLTGNQLLIVSLGDKSSKRVFRLVDANAVAEIRSTGLDP